MFTGGGDLGKAALAAVVASLLTFGGLVYSPVMAADPVTDANGNTITNTDTQTDINANITGKDNKVTDSSNAEIVGDKNTVTNEVKDENGKVVAKVRSNDARIVGSNNTISGSRNQQVIGDHNTIIGRDKGTVTDSRDLSVADITIGRENTIHSGDTYRNKWDSLTVIGNHNIADSKLVDSAGGPASGIVVGSNQNIDGIEESIVIGSLSPAEQNEKTDNPNHHDKYTVGRNSIILGNHASNTMGESIVVGNRSQGNGEFQTIMGHRSVIQGYADQSEANHIAENYGALSSIYGAFNTIESARPVFEDSSNDDPYFKAVDGFGNSINGTLNKTSSARGTMIMGAANTVTHSQPDIIKAKVFGNDDSMDDVWLQDVTSAVQYYNLGDDNNLMNLSYDDAIAAMKAYAANASGAVSVLGNGNAADYAIRSQILGTANTLTGNQNKISANNTINGYGNTGTNITHSAVVGSNNTLSNGEDNVVIGDYHNMDGGKHNVVLGSMKSKEQTSQKEYKSPVWQNVKYNVTEQVPVKDHTKDIENAVMVGYNTDATVDGGVALGSESIASTKAGIAGFDAKGKTHAKSDKDYATWVSTDAAVSVGGAEREVKYKDKEGKDQTQTVKSTRQITNLAAGTQDTDAVNVAQLKSARTHFYSVNSEDTKAKNYNNDGATAANALAAGVGANADKASAVAIGDTAYAGSENGVAIGTGSWIRSSNGNKTNANGGDVAIGQDSHVDSYVNQGGSIALGQNARVENMYGNTEKSYAFGQTEFDADNIPLNPGNEAGGVAIGRNSFARTGSLMVGSHMYKGAIADMDEVDGTDSQKLRDNFNNINMTTLGTNSFNNGTFATVTGSYSATTAKKKTQNFAATVAGSLNSIESYKDANDNSGVASSIVGTANRIANSNNTTILGAGNEVTNSLTDFTAPTEGGASAKALQDTLKDTLQKDAKGAVVVSGIGNKVDSANSISLSGSRNTIKSTKNAQIFGDNREVTNSNGVIIIGSADKTLKTANVQNSTIIGYNANAQNDALAVGESAKAGNNSIAIGMHASAGYSQNMALGYYASVANGVTNSTALGHGSQVTKRDILKSDGNDGVVSIGKSVGQSGEAGMTRRIINVKAGVNDTDAVNVSQLKGVQDGLTHFYSVNSTDETAGNYNNDGAKGENSLAAGVGALANGSNSVAIGTNAKAQNDALAVGENASAGNNGIAIGMHANAGWGQNMALGYYASVENDVRNSTALGYGSQVTKRDILKSDGSDGVISVGKSVGQSGEAGMTRRIINVKAGVNDTDAVNVSQLKQQAQAATTEVVAGTNIVSVTKNDTTADGHTIYKVNAKGTTVSGDGNFNITPKTNDATNVTDYAISLKNTITIGSGEGTHPITIDGTKGEVSGLTNTTWDKDVNYSTSTKAATEAQLQKAMNDAQEAAEANDTDTHVKVGTYAVGDNHQVSMDIVDKKGNATGDKVTITDVAKASDVGDVSKLSKEIQNTEGSTTVVDAINNVNTKVDKVDEKVGDLQYGTEGQTNVVTNGDSVTKAIGDLDKAIGKAATEAGKHTSVSTTDSNLSVNNIAKEGEAANYQISLNKDLNVDSVTATNKIKTNNLEATGSATIGKVTINADDKGTIGGLTNKTWDAKNITSGQAATEDQLQAATKNAVNYDGDESKTITLREDTTIKNVADTTIEEGSKNAVNAGTVYKETRVEKRRELRQTGQYGG